MLTAIGIVIALFGIVHIIYGEIKIIPKLKSTNDKLLIGSVRIMSVQGGMILLAAGVIQFLSALNIIHFHGLSSRVPMGILILLLLSFITTALLFHRNLFRYSILQIFIFIIVIVLQYLSLNNYI